MSALDDVDFIRAVAERLAAVKARHASGTMTPDDVPFLIEFAEAAAKAVDDLLIRCDLAEVEERGFQAHAAALRAGNLAFDLEIRLALERARWARSQP